MKINFFAISNYIFFFCICSAVKIPSITKAVARVTKASKQPPEEDNSTIQILVEDDDVEMKPVTVHKNSARKCTAKKKTVKKAVSKKETTAPEPDKSKVLTTKEVKISLSKTDDTRNKTETENKDEIKLVLQIADVQDGEEGIEKMDKPKFKHVQKAR